MISTYSLWRIILITYILRPRIISQVFIQIIFIHCLRLKFPLLHIGKLSFINLYLPTMSIPIKNYRSSFKNTNLNRTPLIWCTTY